MPFPPDPIAANKLPGPPVSNNEHPEHHNLLATAINDTVTELVDVKADVQALLAAPDIGDSPTFTGLVSHDGPGTDLKRTVGGGTYLRMYSNTSNYISFFSNALAPLGYMDIDAAGNFWRFRNGAGEIFFQYNVGTGVVTFPDGGADAASISFADLTEQYEATDVAGALAEVMSVASGGGGGGGAVLSVNGQDGTVVLGATEVGALHAVNGGGDTINTLTNATGNPFNLNLALGNIQHIASTQGNYTLSVSGGLVGKARSWTLIVDTTTTNHNLSWFGNITWVGGTPSIVWTGSTRHIFQFLSLDGTNTIGFHLTPSPPIESKEYSKAGTLAQAQGTFRLYNDSGQTRTITSVRASVGTAPTGANIRVDVNKNGTTIFNAIDGTPSSTNDRPTITHTPSINTDEAVPIVTSWASGEYLTIDVDQVGSIFAGSDLVVQVSYRQGS
jgi:hypothetical protein